MTAYTATTATTCIGWDADPACSFYKTRFHGCASHDGHAGDHICPCGARTRGGSRMGRRGRPEEPSAEQPRGHHWRGKAILV